MQVQKYVKAPDNIFGPVAIGNQACFVDGSIEDPFIDESDITGRPPGLNNLLQARI